MKQIVLHIGANKTGSSAIQRFLQLNVDPLRELGIIVPSCDFLPSSQVGDQVWFFESLLQNGAGRSILNERLRQTMAEVPDGGQLVISAENLSNANGSHALFADIAQQYDVRVVLYIRRQDELLLSSWQQWDSKINDDFWAWLISSLGQVGNWRAVLKAWGQIFSRQQITVRIYDRSRLAKQNVVVDFLQVLGIPEDRPKLKIPNWTVNPSYSEAVLDLTAGNSFLFQSAHSNDFHAMVRDLTGKQFHRNPRESRITFAQREAILAHYRASNNWVRERYFPDLTEALFAPPAASDYDHIGRDALETQKWGVVASLILGLYQKLPK